MFFAYKEIGKAIEAAVREIHWIDLDKGQLDDPENFHSLIQPAVLIGNSEVEWSGTGSGYSQGDGQITVKLVLVLPSETHLTSPLLLDSLKALELSEPVNQAVLSVPGVLSRTKSSDYPAGSYYVVEQIYTVSFKKSPSIVRRVVAVSVTPQLHKPSTQAQA